MTEEDKIRRMRKQYLEEMQRLAPITEEAWRDYAERNLEKLAEMEDIEAQKE